ncbi:MAG TPA: glycosyltransferase family 39 protein [Blastocatellia bacterium]|nr:glycosyltransferase family 39 protein [Blastocatellia bacterium]
MANPSTPESGTHVETAPEARHAQPVLPLLIAAVGGLICYGLFFNRGIWLSVVGYSIAPAERVMQGDVPYRDFLFNYTPGVLWLNAVVMKLFGVALMPIRIGLFAFKLASLIVLYLVGRRLIGSWPALIPVALTLGWLGHKYIFNVHPTQYSMLFVLLALFPMLIYDDREGKRWLLLCGVAIGCVLLLKYNVGILLLAAATASLLIREKLRGNGLFSVAIVKKCAAVWAGFAVIAALLCVYMAYHRALGPMVEHFIHHASDYAEERAVGLAPLRSLFPVAAACITVLVGVLLTLRFAPKLFRPYGTLMMVLGSTAILIPGRAYILKDSATAAMAYFPLLVFGGALVMLLLKFRKGSSASPKSARQLVIVGLFALAAYLEVFPRADYYHLVRVLPPVFLLLCLLISQIFPVAERYFKTYRPRQATQVSMAAPLVLLLALGLQDTWRPQFDWRLRFINRFPAPADRARGILVGRRPAERIGRMTEIIQQNSSEDDYIFSFARRGGAFYFLAGRRNPSRLLWWDSAGIKQEDKGAVLGMLAEKRMKLILIQDGLADQRVRSSVNANYHEIGEVADIAIYDRNP